MQLVDLERAIGAAGLTGRQAGVLRLVYVEDRTIGEVAAAVGVSKTKVDEELNEIWRKIASVYGEWKE